MDKPRLTVLTDPTEFERLKNDLSAPWPIFYDNRAYVDADELRAWRDLQSETEVKS
jgi:hypothetical protein